MRDDLIFTGIPEKTQRYEECVENLRDLLRRKLHFFGDISFERVHKLGKDYRTSSFKNGPVIFPSHQRVRFIGLLRQLWSRNIFRNITKNI